MAYDPNSTETNSATESKGYTFGLEGDLFVIVVLTVFFSIALFTTFYTLLGWNIVGAMLVVGLPASVILLWVFKLKQRKPPGFDVDWFETQVTGHSWSYDPRQQPQERQSKR